MGLMEALSGWLKQIVAVVLLAALVDLVLPNRTMQRYVRLVAGLIVLLTMATPALQWVRGDFDSKLAAGMHAVEADPQSAPDELARIEEEGRRWRERGSIEAFALAADRLQEAIRLDVEKIAGLPVEQVQVELEPAAGGESAEVRSVAVLLGDSAAASGRQEAAQEAAQPAPQPSDGMQPVETVKPVTLTAPEPVRPSGGSPAAQESPDPALLGRIAALIATRYGIPPDRIQVAGGGG